MLQMGWPARQHPVGIWLDSKFQAILLSIEFTNNSFSFHWHYCSFDWCGNTSSVSFFRNTKYNVDAHTHHHTHTTHILKTLPLLRVLLLLSNSKLALLFLCARWIFQAFRNLHLLAQDLEGITVVIPKVIHLLWFIGNWTLLVLN
jgi:hypothetical protein